MAEIIRHYAGGMMAAVASLTLVFFLFGGVTDGAGNQGILKMTGETLKTEYTDYHTFSDFRNVEMEAAKLYPGIIERFSEGEIKVSEGYVLTDYVKAVDVAGTEYPIKLISILDSGKNERKQDFYHEEDGTVCFDKSGVYEVKIMVKNDAGKKKYHVLSVSVMRQPVGGII